GRLEIEDWHSRGHLDGLAGRAGRQVWVDLSNLIHLDDDAGLLLRRKAGSGDGDGVGAWCELRRAVSATRVRLHHHVRRSGFIVNGYGRVRDRCFCCIEYRPCDTALCGGL